MFLWLQRMAVGEGRVAWRRVLAARGILGSTKRTRQAIPPKKKTGLYVKLLQTYK